MTASDANEADQSCHPLRTIGIGGDDLIEGVREEIRRRLKKAGGNRVLAVESAFADLHSHGCLTEVDTKYLHQMVSIIYKVDSGDTKNQDGVRALESLNQEALVDPQVSQLGSTILGVAYSKSQDEAMAMGGLFGMAVGGLLGFAVGGQAGASVGALVGLLVGSWAAGLCEANE